MRKFASSAPPLAHFLDTDDNLSALAQQVSAIRRIERIWQGIVPIQLQTGTRLGQPKDGVLPVYCANAAIAAKLRQLASRIGQALAAEYQPLELNIKVRVDQAATPQRYIPPRTLSDQALQQLRTLHDRLDECELKDALTRLLASRPVEPEPRS